MRSCQHPLIVAYREANRKDPDIAAHFVNSFIQDYPGVAESCLLPRWTSLVNACLASREVAHSQNRLLVWQQSLKLFPETHKTFPWPPPPEPPPPPPKGRACFPADTPVWVNGALVQISKVVSGQMAGGLHCDLATDCLEQIETVEEHEGTFVCRGIVLESGNRISVVDTHCFMLESGRWIAAQDLRSGLRLKTLNGTVCIKSVAIRAALFVGKVYNLKVKGADRYIVGKDRVIVRDY